MNYPVLSNQLDHFLNQIRSIKPLTAEREYELAVRYKESGEIGAAHALVVSHLPFVVKVAFKYRYYRISLQDLIQEGTIGLMKAVKRFDPYKGFRLTSFAIWWIKAYIKNYIVKSWNLVKLGTTQAQRKLFFRMGEIGEHPDNESRDKRIDELARELKVKSDEVIEMEARVKAREQSLNETIGEDKNLSPIEMLEDSSANQEEQLIERETEEELSHATKNAMKKLDARERFIITKRFMNESRWTLQKLGDHFGTSRERVRQLEKQALVKLKEEFSPQMEAAAVPV